MRNEMRGRPQLYCGISAISLTPGFAETPLTEARR